MEYKETLLMPKTKFEIDVYKRQEPGIIGAAMLPKAYVKD